MINTDISLLKEKTLGIVSSYSDNCGNATYTKQLMHDLKKHFKKVECVDLKQKLIHSEVHNKFKKSIINEAKKYDYLNIQCEPGLFHKKARKAVKFIEEIIDARNGNNISVTFHSIDISPEFLKMSKLSRKFFKIGHSIRKFFKKGIDIDVYKEYQSILLKKISKLQSLNKNISIIVHQKELSEKMALFGIGSYFHPIVSAHSEDLKNILGFDNLREAVLEKYNLDKEMTYIGFFGFYGPYKGLDVLLDAMNFLPSNYKILLSSNCHPINNLKVRKISIRKISNFKNKNKQKVNDEIKKDQEEIVVEQDNYMMSLMKKIIRNSLIERVYFVNHIIDEEEFKKLIAASDINVFPYYEVGQRGSGPVSYATHLSQSGKLILSRTNLFETYENNFFNDCFTFFDQGNYLELSQKILNVHSKNKELCEARKKYNPDSNINTYINSLIGNKDVSNYIKDESDILSTSRY